MGAAHAQLTRRKGPTLILSPGTKHAAAVPRLELGRPALWVDRVARAEARVEAGAVRLLRRVAMHWPLSTRGAALARDARTRPRRDRQVAGQQRRRRRGQRRRRWRRIGRRRRSGWRRGQRRRRWQRRRWRCGRRAERHRQRHVRVPHKVASARRAPADTLRQAQAVHLWTCVRWS